MKFANPMNDIAFKKIFGDEKKKSILISFLNAILDFKGENTIVDITLLNPYQVPKIEELKETILDIQATNEKKENFIIEMQKKDLGDFTKRSLYYTSKAYVTQLDKGNDYSKLKRVYFIGILNFEMFEGENYISRHLILNRETLKQELTDFLEESASHKEFTFIELKKFNKELKELNTVLDKWLYFIKNAKDLEMIPKEFESIEEFKEAFESATQYSWNKEEMRVYDYIALKEFDEINALRTAERKGIEKGEEKAKLEIAKNLLQQSIDIQTISISTNLTIDEIEKLIEENKK